MNKFLIKLIVGIVASIIIGGIFVYFQMNKELRITGALIEKGVTVEFVSIEDTGNGRPYDVKPLTQEKIYSPTNINTVPVGTREILISCAADEGLIDERSIFVTLEINVNGEKEKIPAGIGIDGICFSEIHTDKKDGEIHIVSTEPESDLTLGDFFAVWEKNIIRPGLGLSIFVDDVMVWGARYISDNLVGSIEDVVFEDGRNIRMEYGSKG